MISNMDSSCFHAGLTYLLAVGVGVAAIALSSWLVLLMRAVYREDGGFRSGLANATPLWMPALTGVVAIFSFANLLVGWASTCLPADGWSIVGSLFILLGLALAFLAVGRLILGRICAGNVTGPVEDSDQAEAQQTSVGSTKATGRPRKLPLERRRVIVEYALTYGAAVVIILIGVGFA